MFEIFYNSNQACGGQLTSTPKTTTCKLPLTISGQTKEL